MTKPQPSRRLDWWKVLGLAICVASAALVIWILWEVVTHV